MAVVLIIFNFNLRTWNLRSAVATIFMWTVARPQRMFCATLGVMLCHVVQNIGLAPPVLRTFSQQKDSSGWLMCSLLHKHRCQNYG